MPWRCVVFCGADQRAPYNRRGKRGVLTPGTRLGPYEIQTVIGVGGMGAVYKARDTRLDRVVAIKLLTAPAEQMTAMRDRIASEARAVSQLNHPHICTLYDIGESAPEPGGAAVSYLVMEFVEGETLAARLEKGPLPVDRALPLAAQIADALDRAHRSGIIHGDLKPGNVMLTKSGIKLLDFGLARQRRPLPPADWADTATRAVEVAPAEAVMGTLQYLAPEQLEGRPSDERADIFACGAVIYEMVTGRRAFDGETRAAVVAAILNKTPTPASRVVPGVPPAVDRLIEACLAKEPDERWQHAGDLTRALHWVTAGGAEEPVTQQATPRTTSRLWQAATAALALAVVLLGGFLWRSLTPARAPLIRSSILLPDGLRFPSGGTIGGGSRLALSPDGRTLVVVGADASGNQMLWMRALDAATAVAIPGTDGASSPFWSPDSRSVAFIANGQLKTVDITGGSPVVVATPALNAVGAWGGDNEILFTPTGTAPLSLVSASGGTPRAVTALDVQAGDQVHRNPAFLPDGRHFLFVRVGANGNGANRRAVWVGSIDDEEPSLLIDNATGVHYSNGYVLFLRESSVLAQAFDPSSRTLRGEPRSLAEQVDVGGPLAASFAVSDTGILAYTPASQAGSQLVWFDREGRQLGTVGDAADYGDVELSPDGRMAAVTVLDTATNTRDLWLVDVARGVRTRFTFDRGEDLAPIWSRDGSRVLFTSNRSGRFDLYERAASGVSPESLVFADPADKYPTSWLSDAQTLLYWTFNPDGTALRLLTLAGGPHATTFIGSPVSPGRFSPDSRHVLYYSNESGRAEVYIVPYPVPTRKWQVSSAGGSFARWRADGNEVYYIGRDNKLTAVPVNLATDRIELGQAAPLFEARPVGPRYFYDVAPGGERFLVNVVRGGSATASVTLVQNWGQAQP